MCDRRGFKIQRSFPDFFSFLGLEASRHRLTQGNLFLPMSPLAWLVAPFQRFTWTRLLMVAAVAHRMLRRETPAVAMACPLSKMQGSKLSLLLSARRFAACLSRDDMDVSRFIAATEDFVQGVELFGDFTSRGVSDVVTAAGFGTPSLPPARQKAPLADAPDLVSEG